jgi:sugar lactone lactonase YvrE
VRFGLLVLGAAFALHAAAEEVRLKEQAYYPEGPAVVGGALYWAEMPLHRIRRHKDGKTTTVWEEPGCGPTSIKPDGRGGFWILCHLAHRVLRVNGNFQIVKRLETDGVGRRLAFPNDATVDRRGQLYFTSSGVFSLSAPSQGAVYFVDLQDEPHRVAEGLRYANGIRIDEKRSRLYVSEHLARRVLVMSVAKPGEVGAPSVFFDLASLPPASVAYPLAGPDGLLLDDKGRLYVAEYGAARVMLLSTEGKLQRVIPVPMQFVTNFAFLPTGQLVVVGAFQNDQPPMPGLVMTLAPFAQ